MVHYREASFWLEDLLVEGNPCKVCVRQILDYLRGYEGVIALRVTVHPHEVGLAVVTIKYNPDFVEIPRLRGAFEGDLGFAVREVVSAGGPTVR